MESKFGSVVYCGRCAHPLPDETQSFCSTCGAEFSRHPPTSDFSLIVEHRINLEYRNFARKRAFILGGWISLCFLLLFSASSIYRGIRLERLSEDREVEFYVTNFEGFPAISPDRAREAVLIALQSYEDHFGMKIKRWRFVEDEIPKEIADHVKSTSLENLQDLSAWQAFFRSQLYPSWYQNPYEPLKVFISNFPLKAPSFLRMETRHLSSSRLVGGFATPAFVLISSYRLLTEIDEKDPAMQSKYLGEYLVAHELGHALLGLPDFVSTTSTDFAARGIASNPEPPFASCIMHTDEGGGAEAWKALRDRKVGTAAMCNSYDDILLAHKLHREAVELVRKGDITTAEKKFDAALEMLPQERALPWIRDQWAEERRLLSRF